MPSLRRAPTSPASRWAGRRISAGRALGGEVRFGGAKITNVLLFRSAGEHRSEFDGEAGFHGIEVGGQASFNGARFGGVVRFDGAKITGDLFFRPAGQHRAEFEGKAGFPGIEVSGQADFSGARFGREVRFDGAKITGGLFFRPEEGHRAEFEGEAGFHGIKVGGQAGFNGARFRRKVRFDQAKITGSLFFRPAGEHGAEFEGEAGFHGIEVSGQANFTGVRFGGSAYFEGATFSGNVLFDGASFTGSVASFLSASFSLAALFAGTRFACTVDFDHANFHQQVYFSGTIFDGNLSLREARFRTLSFAHEGEVTIFAADVRVDLRGCTYSFIEISDWRELMKRMEAPASQPWGQLIRALRAAGEERAAREAYYEWRISAGARIHYSEHKLRYLWDRFQRHVAGYGVRSGPLFLWAGVILALGAVVFAMPGALLPAKDFPAELSAELEAAHSWYAALPQGLAASVRLFVPVEVYVGRHWEPAPGGYSVWAVIMTLFGWILIPVAVASFTGLLRREPAP